MWKQNIKKKNYSKTANANANETQKYEKQQQQQQKITNDQLHSII